MTLLDGKKVAREIQNKLQIKIDSLPVKPGLCVIMVGSNPESLIYVTMKLKKCKEMNINTYFFNFNEDDSEDTIINKINEMNECVAVHGILVQLPLPKNLDTDSILNAVSKEKDVDGFNSYNAGLLFQNKKTLFTPCTPKGCITLLDYYNIEVRGLNITIIGSSNLVGLPLSMMLLHRGATVTICHEGTIDVKSKCLKADMVIACCGVPKLVKGDWITDDTIVIDIGTNKDKQTKLVGDVDFENVRDKCSYITPVPGGIGPMTIMMVIQQTVEACATMPKI